MAFLNRLLGTPDGWTDARALLADFCAAYGARAAGVRWPADGPVWSTVCDLAEGFAGTWVLIGARMVEPAVNSHGLEWAVRASAAEIEALDAAVATA